LCCSLCAAACSENESPAGNPGKIMLELIERAASYFGHDDIIRIEDEYQRA
jgi:hypothetical protein